MVLSAQPGNRPAVGDPAPDFNIGLYKDYRADLPQSIKLSDLRGKVVVLNFWASWCVECRKESDSLEATWRQYRDRGLVVLGVDYLDTESPAIQYLQQYNTSYPIGVDLQEQISHRYRITGVPETFFIEKNGVVRKTVI
jgi:cytochrome c biogenesis protein CcmG/thiol:disulfide interchange protein DsbE